MPAFLMSSYPSLRLGDKSQNLMNLEATLHGSWEALVKLLELGVPSALLVRLLDRQEPRL